MTRIQPLVPMDLLSSHRMKPRRYPTTDEEQEAVLGRWDGFDLETPCRCGSTRGVASNLRGGKACRRCGEVL